MKRKIEAFLNIVRKRDGHQPEFMQVLLRKITATGFEIAQPILDSNFDLYHGDMIDGGRGEILLRA